MSADREEILADGQQRFGDALLKAEQLHTQYLAAIVEADEIRAEVEQATGVSLGPAAPYRRPERVEEYGVFEVLEATARWAAFGDAVLLLAPFLEAAPHRTVGAVLKTCDRAVAVQIREALTRAGLLQE